MRKLNFILLALTLSIALLVVSVAPAIAGKPINTPSSTVHVILPFDEVGVHAGAAYEISVPENWNGTLIVYAHGLYAEISPYGEPLLVIPEPGMIAPGSQGGPDIEAQLLEAGYALAGSSYSGSGWAVKEGIQDTIALTTYFNGKVGKPKHTILWGFSMGGDIALEIIERSAGIFDGIIVEGSNGLAATQVFDSFLSIQVAYDVIFGWPEELGSVGDLRDDIDCGDDVWPALMADIYRFMYHGGTLEDYGNSEFFRLLLGMEPTVFYDQMGWGLLMWFVTMVGADLEAKAGGNPLQNLDAPQLSLSPSDKAYLGTLGINADAKLAEMNAIKIEASPSARNYLEHYATPTGNIKLPLIQVHSVTDEMNNVFGTIAYKNLVNGAGKGNLLLQAYAGAGTGHGTLTPDQYFQTIAAMQEWLDTGIRPDPADYFTGYGFVSWP